MVSISGTTTAAQIRDFERQMRDVAVDKIPRSVQFALNGVSIHAAKKMAEVLPTVLDNPTPWITKAFIAKKGDLKVSRLNDVKSSLEVKPQQSAALKYLYGDGDDSIRQAGDIGPAQTKTLIPIWPGLERRSKIKKNKYGNIPAKALTKLLAGTGVAGGVFWGSPSMYARTGKYGLYARPAASGRGLPTLLLRAVDQTRHPDILTIPTRKVAEQAMETLAGRLETELRSQIARQAARNGTGPR